MAQYGWTIETLLDKFDLINEIIDKETNKDKLKLLKEDRETLIMFIGNSLNQEKEETNTLTNKDIQNALQTINYLWPYYESFSAIVTAPIDTVALPKITLTDEDILTITHDFFKNQNAFFYSYFMQTFKDKDKHLAFRQNEIPKIDGQILELSSINESYIEIFRDYTANDIITTIHEYTHATSYQINQKHFNKKKSLYSEIDTLFMELISFDYLKNIFGESNNIIMHANSLNDYYSDANKINKTINYFQKQNSNMKNISQKISGDLPIYLTSYLFAIELYETYQKDKDKALYYLKQIILLKDLKEKEYFYKIQKMGIIPNEHLKNYYNEVQEKALKLSRTK